MPALPGGQLLRHDFVNQALGDGLLRVGKHVQHRAQFDHLPGLHHRHAVGNLFDDLHLVGDQHHGHAQLAIDLAQQIQNGAGGFGVQGAGGLVREQHARVGGQRPGNAHALLLPAGNLRWVAVGQVRQAHQLQQRGDALGNLGLAHPGQLQRQGGVVKHGARRQQVEVLKHHANLLPGLAQLGIR